MLIEVLKTEKIESGRERIDINSGRISHAYCGHIFPLGKSSLVAENYGIVIQIWIKKKNFDKISIGQESFYEFITVKFHNCPDGCLLFEKKTPRTIAKKWVSEAIKNPEVISLIEN